MEIKDECGDTQAHAPKKGQEAADRPGKWRACGQVLGQEERGEAEA